MLVIQTHDLNKSYGTDVILDDVSFSINKGDRVGVVGPNGMGKTTLLSMLAGEMEPTSGSVYVRSGMTVGFLRQKNNFAPDGTVIAEAEKSIERFRAMEQELARLEEQFGIHAEGSESLVDGSARSDDKALSSAIDRYTLLMEKYKNDGGFTYKSELTAVLRSMGFDESWYDKRIGMLSGGERTRLALACMLLRKPDILMLDEPTNHLDLGMLAWLEDFLKAYKGTIIVVSHDRYFLDKIVNGILDVRERGVTQYRGNYTEYLVKREERRKAAEKAYEKQQKEIAKQEEIIRRFKGHNTEKLVKRAQSREKKLEHMERLEKPHEANTRMRISFSSDYKSGNDVAQGEDLKKSFGDRLLFENVAFDIKKGERICIIGENGVGKTTLLKIMIGLEKADEGYLRIGHNVDFGYYDQGQLLLDDSKTVLGEMNDAYRLISDTEMRSILGRFLFRGDDVFKEVGSLSGGEKAKLSLLKLMLSGANTLVLDEPTNHLDIESREAVESALNEYDGTIIMVSHDRYLLDKFPDRILELGVHGLTEYKGKFDYYLEKNAERAAVNADQNGAAQGTESKTATQVAMSSEEERRLRKEREAEERRRARELAALEEAIPELEEKIYSLEQELCSEENFRDVMLMRRLSDELEDTKLELEDSYARWLSLQE